MILLCGIPSEPPLEMVMQAAEEMRVPYVLFNQRESGWSDICFEIAGGKPRGALRLRETDWRLQDFQGVYVRLMDHRDLPERPRGRSRPELQQSRKSTLLHEALMEWMEICQARVMNRCGDMASNVSKPFQAQLIAAAGFRTPVTLISNQPEEVRAFYEKHRRVVYKSISSVRSIVEELSPDKFKELSRVRNLPTQFQAFVPGVNIRVHVTGRELFAAEIRSEAVDYRYASRANLTVEMAPIELPPDIAQRCLALSETLRLPLCGIDLKRTPASEYFCFEVNPSPGYSYFQEGSGVNIAQGIVRYLAASE